MRITRWFCPVMMALAAISFAAVDGVAQQLRVGDRIRIKTVSGEASQLIGTYFSSDSDNLVLHTNEAGRYTIPWYDVSRLELSRGRQSNAGKGALIGLGVGGGLGLVTMIAVAADDDDFYDVNAGDAVLGTISMAALGAGVGALIGLLSTSERWEKISRSNWQIQVTPDLEGGVTVGVNLRL